MIGGETTEDLLGDACTICLEEKDSNMSRHVGCTCILCDSCIAVSVDLTQFKHLSICIIYNLLEQSFNFLTFSVFYLFLKVYHCVYRIYYLWILITVITTQRRNVCNMTIIYFFIAYKFINDYLYLCKPSGSHLNIITVIFRYYNQG